MEFVLHRRQFALGLALVGLGLLAFEAHVIEPAIGLCIVGLIVAATSWRPAAEQATPRVAEATRRRIVRESEARALPERVEQAKRVRAAREERERAEQERARELAARPAGLVGERVARAVFRAPDGAIGGLFELALEEVEGRVRLSVSSAFRLTLPTWIQGRGDEIEYVPGRGTPTALRVLLECVHELGAIGRRIDEVYVPCLQELEAAAQVAAGTTAGRTARDVLPETQVVKGIQSVVTQLGFRLTLERVGAERLASYRVADVLEGFQRPYWDAPEREGESTSRRERFFASHPELEPESRLLMDWSLTFRAEPWTARGRGSAA